MDVLKKYTVEVIAAVWLVIVALQYLSSYFAPALGELDFKFAYIAMLYLAVGIGLHRGIRFYTSRHG